METTIPSPTTSERLGAGFAAVRSLDLSQAQEPTRQAALDVAEIVRTLDADEDVDGRDAATTDGGEASRPGRR